MCQNFSAGVEPSETDMSPLRRQVKVSGRLRLEKDFLARHKEVKLQVNSSMDNVKIVERSGHSFGVSSKKRSLTPDVNL